MKLLQVYRPHEKYLSMNFKFRWNSKRKQFISRNEPFLKLRRRKIRAFHSSSGKPRSRKTIGSVLLLLRCCRSWARHALRAQDKPCKQPPAPRRRHNSRSVIPGPCPHGAGRRARCLCRRPLQLGRGEVSQHAGCPQHPTPTGVRLPAPLSLQRGLPHLGLALLPTTWLCLIVISFVAFLKQTWVLFLTKIWVIS